MVQPYALVQRHISKTIKFSVTKTPTLHRSPRLHLIIASFVWWHLSQVTSLADTWPWSSRSGCDRTKRNTHLPVSPAASASIPTSPCNQAKPTLEWVQTTGSRQQAGGFYHDQHSLLRNILKRFTTPVLDDTGSNYCR